MLGTGCVRSDRTYVKSSIFLSIINGSPKCLEQNVCKATEHKLYPVDFCQLLMGAPNFWNRMCAKRQNIRYIQYIFLL
jgi:hypothetical protein